MSDQTVTFEAPEDSIATIDEIAANLGTDRSHVLREAVAAYLADYEALKGGLEEGVRQADAGETIDHEVVLAQYNSWKSSTKAREAA